MRQRVTVVGAGVLGLTCAVRLAERGVAVDVLARDLPLETASAAGGALWLPATRDERELGWAATTLAELRAAENAGEAPARGPHRARSPPRRPRPRRRPHGRSGSATPSGSSTRARPRSATRPGGGRRAPARRPAPLPAVAARPACSTPAARSPGWRFPRCPPAASSSTPPASPPGALAADPRVRPVRTQTVLLENPGLDAWWWDLTAPFSACRTATWSPSRAPATRTTGTRRPTRKAAVRLAERAAELVPRLRGARVTGVRVGLRPGPARGPRRGRAPAHGRGRRPHPRALLRPRLARLHPLLGLRGRGRPPRRRRARRQGRVARRLTGF